MERKQSAHQRSDKVYRKAAALRDAFPMLNTSEDNHSFDHIFSFDSEYEQYLEPSSSNFISKLSSLSGFSTEFSSNQTKSAQSNSSSTYPERTSQLSPLGENYPSSSHYPSQLNSYQSHSGSSASYNFQIPQRDPGPGTSGQSLNPHNISLDLSLTNPFDSPSLTLVENLLESPSENLSSHFQGGQLRFDTVTSDSEASVFSESHSVDKDVFDDDHLSNLLETKVKRKHWRSLEFHQSTPSVKGNLEIKKGDKLVSVSKITSIEAQEQSERDLEITQALSERGMMEGDGTFSSDFDMYAMDGNMAVHPDIDDSPYPGGIFPSPGPQRYLSPDQMKSPSSTEEALALQRAVIGSSVAKPASMDEINAAIAAVERQYRERLGNLGEKRHINNEAEVDGLSLGSLGEDRQFHSSNNSLDETPTKLPAPHKIVNDVDHDKDTASDISQISEEDQFHPLPQVHREALQKSSEGVRTKRNKHPQPGSIKQKASSLLAQNTGLAVKSAVAGKFNTSPSTSATIGGRVLYRSPVEWVPTHKGGKNISIPEVPNHQQINENVNDLEGGGDAYLEGFNNQSHTHLEVSKSPPNGVPPPLASNGHNSEVGDNKMLHSDNISQELPIKMKSLPSENSSNRDSVDSGIASNLSSNSPASQGGERPREAVSTKVSHSRRTVPYSPSPIFPVKRKDLNKMPSTSLSQVRQIAPESKSSLVTSSNPEIMALLRERAKLEGQLETLLVETEAALQARAELQSQVAGLHAQLRAQNAAVEQADEERIVLENNLATVRSDRNQLEDRVVALENNLDMKENSLENAKRELDNSKTNNQRLQARLEDVRGDIENRELNIARLRKKVETLAKELESSQEDTSETSLDVRSIQAELVSAQKTKDWFQEQLQMAQEVRNKLQRELSESQDKSRGQASVIEALKTENTQINQVLSETRQQALQEKEQIAKHLETIEADILAREAAFVEMHREKSAVHDAVIAQMDQMEMEKHKIANLVASAVELERQLEVAQKDLTDKKTRLFELESEKKELVKELSLAKESLSTKERELEASQVKCKDLETRLQEKQAQSAHQEDELGQLRSDKTALEAAFITANEEKRTFDTALQNLREDMAKVEQRFKQMKQEVGKREEELEVSKKKGEQSQDRLQGLEEQLREEQQNLEGYAAVLGTKDTQLKELEHSNRTLQNELEQLKRELEAHKESTDSTHRAYGQAQAELQQARDSIRNLEKHIQDTAGQTANLQGQLESLNDDRSRYSHLLDENDFLKQHLAEAKSSNHREIAEQKSKILRLSTDLNSSQKELKERQRLHEETVGELTQKLRQAENARELLENTLENAQSAAAQMTKAEQIKLTEQLQKATNDSHYLDKAKAHLEDELGDVQNRYETDTAAYAAQIQQLEAELQNLREEMGVLQENEEANRKLAIELERERGRLQGVQKSHSALKNHAGLLEEALALRESSMTELSAHLNANSQERATEEDKLNQKLIDFEAAMNREKQVSKELRRQLATEKGNCRRAKEQLQKQDVELQENKENLEKANGELQAVQGTMNELRQTEQAQKAQLEGSKKELELTKAQIEHLQRQLQNNLAQNPVLEDQMQTLSWENEQRAREVEAMKEQMELSEKRQRLEMDGIKNNLQMSKKELEGLKRELALTRKEKFAFQAKVGQLKAALKATVQQNKLLKAKLKAKKAQEPQGQSSHMVDEIVVPEMAYDVESLLATDDVGSLGTGESKPLQALQGCLQSIKSQMGALEKQLEEHTAAVNSSSQAWKEVENRVRDLRKACAKPVPSKVPLGPGTPQPVSQTQPASQTRQAQSLIESSMSAPTLPNVYDI